LSITITASRSARLDPEVSSPSSRVPNALASELACNFCCKTTFAADFSARDSIYVLGQSERRLAVQESLLGELLHRRAREVLQLREQLEVLLDDLDLLLQALGLSLQRRNLHLLGADLLAGVLFDGSDAVASGENADVVGPLGCRPSYRPSGPAVA
jgi:hypothetical protein